MNAGFPLQVWRVYRARVTLVVEYLGWVDLDLGSSSDWWAATVATYCPSRMVEHPKSKSIEPSPPGDGSPCKTLRARAGTSCVEWRPTTDGLRLNYFSFVLAKVCIRLTDPKNAMVWTIT